MAYDLGTARGVIELDYNGRGVDEAKKGMKDVEGSGNKTNDALKKVGTASTRAGLAIVGGLAAGIAAAANFEQKMSGIAAVSGANSSQLEQLRNKALQLGKDTQFSAGEAASAIEELAKAGISIPDIMNGAADATVALAAAGEISLPQAATIASNAMNQFGLTAQEMPKVADAIAGAANASAIDVGQLGESMQQAGAVAHLAGLGFHDTAVAIALMGNAGIAGSDAGTSLKSMLMRLQPTTKAQADLMKHLGLITKDGANQFYDANGKLKSFAQVSGILQGSLKGMTQQQKQATLQTLFGTDAIRAAAIMADNGAAGFNKMSAAIDKTKAADVAKTRMDNFKGSLEQMKGSLETAGIAAGTVLLPMLRKLVDAVTGALNWFLNLSAGTQKWIIVVAAVVGVILLVVGAVIKFILMAAQLQRALIVLKLAFAETWIAALGPIALIIAAVAIVIAIIVLLWKHSAAFRNFFIGIWDAIKNAAQAVGSWFAGPFTNFFVGAWNGIKSGLSAIGNFFKAVWNGIVTVVRIYIMIVVTIIKTYIAIWKAIITTGLNIIKAVWGAIWGTFGGVIRAVFGLIAAIVRLGWTIVKGIFLIELRALLAVTRAVWNGIVAVVRFVWGIIRAVVGAGVRAVRAVVIPVWNAIRAATSAVWNAIMNVIRAVWSRISGAVSAAVGRVRAIVVGAWNAVRGATAAAWNGIKNVVSSAVGAIGHIVGTIKSRVLGALAGAGSWLWNAGKAIIQGLLGGIESMIGAVTSKINSVTSKIKSFLPGSPVKEGPLRSLNHGHSGKEIIRMLMAGIEDAAPMVEATMNAVMPTLPTGGGSLQPPPGSTRPPSAPGAGGSGGLRLIDGELRLDASGRAFIRGVAVEAIDDSNAQDDVLARMGRR